MALETAQQFIDALTVWEDDYQAGHKKLTLLELQAIKALLSQLLTQVNRDLTGPYSSPVFAPPDDAGAN
jgi:hypothetical protein